VPLLRFQDAIQAKAYSHKTKGKMITCTLEFDEEVDRLYDVFLPEVAQSKTNRAEYILKKTDKLLLTVKAKDLPRFMSYMSTVMKILDAYYKIQNGKPE
jgi:tRNA threonylcarbamoyladenosine modification (KEOPS) complex  Pcc1 subunit